MLCLIFISIIIKINHFLFTYSRNSVLHNLPAFVPCGYDVILAKFCNLFLSLLLSAILLIPVYTLCALLLNLCCGFNITSLFNKQSSYSLNLSLRFIIHFFVPFVFFCRYYHHSLSKNILLV